MSCEKFEARLQQLLDERRRPADDYELQQHAHDCSDCRATLQAESLLMSAIRRDISTALPPSFATGVVNAYFAERPPQMGIWKRNLWQLATLAVAALVLIAVVPAFRPIAKTTHPEANVPDVVERKVEHKIEVPTPSLELVKKQDKSDVAQSPLQPLIPSETLTPQKAIQRVRSSEPLSLVSIHNQPLGSGEWIDTLRESISEVSLDDLEPMDQIADGFRPVATSLQSAVSVIRRTLPGAKEQRMKPTPDTSGVWGVVPASA